MSPPAIPPPIKAVEESFGFSPFRKAKSFYRSRRRPGHRASESRNHIISPAMAPKAEKRPHDLPPAQVQRSKSRLIRLLTTKRTDQTGNQSPSSPPQPRTSRRPVPAPNSAFSKEQREAALRERGLLPPLPQKDLSQLEREQDRSIPVVKPDTEKTGDSSEVSAADLIKKQWEAKNKEAASPQRTKLDNFKFGGPSTSPTDSTDDGKPDTSEEEPEPQSPKVPERATRRWGLHQPTLSQPVVISDSSKDHRRSISLQTKTLTPVPETENAKTPITPILDLNYGPEIHSYLSNGSDEGDRLAPSSTLKPAASSRSVSSNKSDRSNKSPALKPHVSGTSTPALPQNGASRTSPVISPPLPTDPTAIIVEDSTSSTSDLTPSLSNSASDSSSNGKSKSTGNQIRFEDGNVTPLIASSSTENKLDTGDGDPFVSGGNLPVVTEGKETRAPSSSGHGHSSGSQEDGSSSAPPPVPPRDHAIHQRKRGMTTDGSRSSAEQEASGAPPVRRKTINPFKRNQPQDGQQAASGGKRTLTTIGRSVVGSVMRPSRSQQRGEGKAPRSPTFSPPGSPTKRDLSQPPVVVRQAVSPAYYNHGDISAQANNIKDDEQRRLAEMAFLY